VPFPNHRVIIGIIIFQAEDYLMLYENAFLWLEMHGIRITMLLARRSND
jgi:hypothetical protein